MYTDTMAFRITVDGIEITASSPSEVAALVRELKNAAPPPYSSARHTKAINGDGPLFQANPDELAVVGLLEAIDKGGADGPTTENIMQVLGVQSGRGIGGRMVRVNNILLRSGFQPTECYDNKRDADGMRRWKPGPRLKEAIDKLKH